MYKIASTQEEKYIDVIMDIWYSTYVLSSKRVIPKYVLTCDTNSYSKEIFSRLFFVKNDKYLSLNVGCVFMISNLLRVIQ